MLTNKCGSKQGAVTKFIRSPRTAISFFLTARKEIAWRSLLRKKKKNKNKNKKKSTEGYKNYSYSINDDKKISFSQFFNLSLLEESLPLSLSLSLFLPPCAIIKMKFYNINPL